MAIRQVQQKIAVRNLVLSPNSQTTYGTAIAGASMTKRPPKMNPDNYVRISKKLYTDEGMANKGHEYMTTRQETDRAVDLQLDLPMTDFLVGWAMANILGAVTTTGAGPYTHVFKPLNSTRVTPVTSIYTEDTSAVKTTYVDMAATELTLSGGGSGPGMMSISFQGSGRFTDAAIGAMPAVSAEILLLASDLDILLGPQAAAVSIKDLVRQWSIKITRTIELHEAPGSGLYITQTNTEKQRASYSMLLRAKDTEVAADPRTLFLADTLQETQFVFNSGAAAQCTVKFPGHYVHAVPVSDGNFVGWQVDATEEDVIKSGANEIVQATVINSQPTFLVGA
jgi:hypothetical protein